MSYIRWLRERVGHERVMLTFAAACIADERGRVLLQKRGDKHTWGFPGGAMELGESAEEAAVREVREETGLSLKIEGLLGVYTKYFDSYPNGDQAQCVAIFFVGTAAGGTPTIDGDETLDLGFFAPEEAPELVNQQHHDALEDFARGRRNVWR